MTYEFTPEEKGFLLAGLNYFIGTIEKAAPDPKKVQSRKNKVTALNDLKLYLNTGRKHENGEPLFEEPIPPGNYNVSYSGTILDGPFKGRKVSPSTSEVVQRVIDNSLPEQPPVAAGVVCKCNEPGAFCPMHGTIPSSPPAPPHPDE